MSQFRIPEEPYRPAAGDKFGVWVGDKLVFSSVLKKWARWKAVQWKRSTFLTKVRWGRLKKEDFPDASPSNP